LRHENEVWWGENGVSSIVYAVCNAPVDQLRCVWDMAMNAGGDVQEEGTRLKSEVDACFCTKLDVS